MASVPPPASGGFWGLWECNSKVVQAAIQGPTVAELVPVRAQAADKRGRHAGGLHSKRRHGPNRPAEVCNHTECVTPGLAMLFL